MMGIAEWVAVALFFIGIIFGVVGWLLRHQNQQQEEQIKLLFKKHDDDAAELLALRLLIAEKHYKKEELDPKFATLEGKITSGFNNIDGKLTEMSRLLINHVQEEK